MAIEITDTIIDLIIKKSLEDKYIRENDDKFLRIEAPNYDTYVKQEEDIKEKIKEPKRVIIIDI